MRYTRGLIQSPNWDLSGLFVHAHTRRSLSSQQLLEELKRKKAAFYDEMPVHVYALFRLKGCRAHGLAIRIMAEYDLAIGPFTPQITRILRELAASDCQSNRKAQSDLCNQLRTIKGWRHSVIPQR